MGTKPLMDAQQIFYTRKEAKNIYKMVLQELQHEMDLMSAIARKFNFANMKTLIIPVTFQIDILFLQIPSYDNMIDKKSKTFLLMICKKLITFRPYLDFNSI